MTVLKDGITLLEASAGTGKTFRIAHTVLRLVVEEGRDLRRLVVVTFTENATAELRHRIRCRLRDARAALSGGVPPDEVLGAWVRTLPDRKLAEVRLRRALEGFDEASISTIHAFCQRVLRRHAFESGASFEQDFGGDAGTLVDELVSDFWTRLTWDAEPVMLPALRAAGVTRDQLLDLAWKATNPDLPVIPTGPEVPAPDVSEWTARKDALRARWRPEDLLRAIAAADVVERASKNHPDSLPPARTRDAVWAVKNDLWKVAPTEALPDWLTFLRPARLAAATRSGPAPTHPGFDALEAFAEAHEQVQAPLLAHVQSVKRQLVKELRTGLPERLRRQGTRTFDDLLRDLRDALRDPGRREGLLAALRSRLELALVDEFQDTDEVQWEIFRTVFPARLVLIGDPKQAIYGFRGADVETYRRAAATVTHREPLDQNFRSDAPLVAAVNHVFGREGLIRPFGGEWPTFHPVVAHHAGSRRIDDDRPALELRFLPRAGASVVQGILASGWLRQHLPERVAADVVAELNRGGQLQTRDGPRRVGPGDCAVLVRSNEQAGAVAHALRSRGVPAVRRTDDSVWSSAVTSDLDRVLAAVHDPLQPKLRRAALLTQLLGRTATEVDALGTDDRAAVAASESFQSWHARWRDDGFGSMFRALMDDERLLERLLSRPDGQRLAADLVHLGELLDDASRRGLGPTALLSWLRRRGPGHDPETARLRLATDEAAVQVVTMHSAKGLEYPLVWCPSLWSGGFLSKKDKVHLVFHDPAADGARTLDIGSADLAEHLEQRAKEQLQEDLRLVYVALTRARHRCVVYWGACAHNSALGTLLHQKPTDPPDDLLAKVRTRLERKDDEALVADLEPVLAHADLGLSRVDWGDVPRDRFVSTEPRVALSVRSLKRAVAPDRSWRRTSFSALLRSADSADPSFHVDHDPGGEAPVPTPGERVPLADLPGGTRMGTFLHHVLELHDFTRPEGLRPLLEEQLPAHGLEVGHAAVLEPALLDVLRTPITEDGLRLEALSGRDRLNELDFAFPLRAGIEGPLTVAALARAFRHPDAPPGFADRLDALGFPPVRGFLVGSIDLVFRHAGRYWLLDWKSNRLGDTWVDYGPDALRHEMAVARYELQAHLYAVALHRFLRLRLRNYAWDRHVGGFQYLFLRGMHPDRTTGVYAGRPTAALVEALDTALAGVAP